MSEYSATYHTLNKYRKQSGCTQTNPAYKLNNEQKRHLHKESTTISIFSLSRIFGSRYATVLQLLH